MDETGGKKRVFNACRCNKDVPPGAATTNNKRKSKTSGIKRSCSRVHVATTENRKENELNNKNCGGGTTAETTAAAALPPAATSSNESVVYLGTFGNSICCSIIDLTSCSPTCLVVKHQKDDRSIINKRRITISSASATTQNVNKFQEHHRHHHYHPAPPPLIHHQSGEFHQSFRPLRPKSYTLTEHLKTRNKSGGQTKSRLLPSPKRHDYCNLEPGCLCTVLNKMPLDLSFNVNEDTVLEHVLDTERRDLVPLFEDLNVSELVVDSLITSPFSVKALLEMYRVDITDTFSSLV